MDILSHITIKEEHHRNQQVLLCLFPYDPNVIAAFKKQFPSASWWRTKNAWYLPNNNLNRLNYPLNQNRPSTKKEVAQ